MDAARTRARRPRRRGSADRVGRSEWRAGSSRRSTRGARAPSRPGSAAARAAPVTARPAPIHRRPRSWQNRRRLRVISAREFRVVLFARVPRKHTKTQRRSHHAYEERWRCSLDSSRHFFAAGGDADTQSSHLFARSGGRVAHSASSRRLCAASPLFPCAAAASYSANCSRRASAAYPVSILNFESGRDHVGRL